jgi:predicted ribosomally synthesized peptide with SipW-like signal peptide
MNAKVRLEERTGRLGTKLGLSLLVLALIGVAVGVGTWSAFSSTTQNSGNSFSAGTVTLADDDAGSAMLSLANAKPGDSDSACIVVSYTGSLAATVRMYGATAGTGLDQYLDLTVIRGSKSSAFKGCGDFVADGTNYIGSGNGVVYSATLQGYPDTYGAGIVDPTPGSPESWTNPESHAYKFVVTVQNNDNAQGLNATQTFTWEARNS